MTGKTTTIVYDTKNGEVVGTIDYREQEDKNMPSESDREKESIEIVVKRTSREKSDLAALHVSEEEMKQYEDFKVDVRNNRLIRKLSK